MNRSPQSSDASAPNPTRLQAAEWVAMLQGPRRSPEMERALSRWLASDPTHQAEFDKATAVWEAIGGLREVRERRATAYRPWMAAAGVMAAAAIAVVVLSPAMLDPASPEQTITTPVGGERVATLADGSRITLNTDTVVRVRYSRHFRRVAVDRGEAIFDVAKNHERPFLVASLGRQVRAVGTSFVVYSAGKDLAITLLEGKVAITSVNSAPWRPGMTPVALQPGQRWDLAQGEVTTLKPEQISSRLAWRQHEVVFEDAALAEAVAEMNRYSTSPIRLDGPVDPELRVSGLFEAGKTEAFVRTLAAVYGLKVRRQDAGFILSPATSP